MAFVEELWEYTPGEVKDVFRTDFGCKRLYRTQPKPTYYVVDVWRVIGDAPIVTDPVTPTISCGTVLRGTGAGGIARNPMAKADSSRTKTDGDSRGRALTQVVTVLKSKYILVQPAGIRV